MEHRRTGSSPRPYLLTGIYQYQLSNLKAQRHSHPHPELRIPTSQPSDSALRSCRRHCKGKCHKPAVHIRAFQLTDSGGVQALSSDCGIGHCKHCLGFYAASRAIRASQSSLGMVRHPLTQISTSGRSQPVSAKVKDSPYRGTLSHSPLGPAAHLVVGRGAACARGVLGCGGAVSVAAHGCSVGTLQWQDPQLAWWWPVCRFTTLKTGASRRALQTSSN